MLTVLTLTNIFHWNFIQNSILFIEENAFKNVVCRMAAILLRPIKWKSIMWLGCCELTTKPKITDKYAWICHLAPAVYGQNICCEMCKYCSMSTYILLWICSPDCDLTSDLVAGSSPYYYTPRFNEVERGVYTGITLSVCPSVDRIVSALYLQQFSSDPFHICTSYQATSEGVSRVMPVSKFKHAILANF